MHKNNPSNGYGTKYVFVSGISNGREIFLGRTSDDTGSGTVTIEGKSIGTASNGCISVRPFTTTCSIDTSTTSCQIHQITNEDACREAANILGAPIATISRTMNPMTCRWIESANATSTNGQGANGSWNTNRATPGTYGAVSYGTTPFATFYYGFTNSAEQFRRALYQSTNVTNTRELDRLIELEASMTVQIGKTVNQIAIQFNTLSSRNGELTSFLDTIYGYGSSSTTCTSANGLSGFTYLMCRMNTAKTWCRRTGKTQLVRDINNLTKTAIHGLNEVILECCTQLDTLITETFSQYGMTYEIHGDLSPFTGYTGNVTGTNEGYEFAVSGAYAGTTL